MLISLDDEYSILTPEIERSIVSCGNATAECERIMIPVSVSLIIVNDSDIRALNKRFRGLDKSTDVLSFPTINYPKNKTAGSCDALILQEYDDETCTCNLGDIVISFEHAQNQAQAYDHSIQREYGFLFTHGLLHLMGYDHIEENDRILMRHQDDAIMELVNLKRENALS